MTYIDTYGGIKKHEKFSLRSLVRKNALDVLGFVNDLKNGNTLKKARIQFLYIHHLFKDEEKGLRNLIDFLNKDHLFISYSDAVVRILSNKIDNAYICFSSDDGLKNNIELSKILDEYGIKACFFICPSITGEKDHNKLKAFCKEKLEFPEVEFLDWKDVDYILKSGHEIGSHTMTHINLSETPANIVEDELQQSYKILQEYCGNIEHFAYPYGRYFHITEQARKLIFRTGYVSCASAERGCHVLQYALPEREKLLIRRDHIIANWNLKHIKYFLRQSAVRKNLQQNDFPFSVS